MPDLPPARDPAAVSAALLGRLAVATLAIGLPVASLLSRRGTVLLLPVGIVLLCLAWVLDGVGRRAQLGAGRMAASPVMAAIVVGLGWAALSRLWSTAPDASPERLTSLVGMLALAGAGFLAIPERMRAANLYLLPIGTALSAALALGLTLVPLTGLADDGDDARSFGRGLAVVVLFGWPSLAWLRSRGRDPEALGLAVLVAAAAAAGSGGAMLAFAAGAVAYALAGAAPRPVIGAAGLGAAALVLAAPLLPLVAAALSARLGGPLASLAPAAHDWWSVVAAEPRRLVTGYGLGSFGQARLAGLVPAATPDTALLQVWYDFGLVGALALAAALGLGFWEIRTAPAALQPGLAATLTTAVTLGALGVGSGQAWWPAALAAVSLVFVAVARGQFRTRLPRAARKAPAVAA